MNITPSARVIFKKTFIQRNVKRKRTYIHRKLIAQTVAKNASPWRKRSSRKPPGVRSQTQYIQPDITASVGLYHIHGIQRVTLVTGDNRDAQNWILKRVRTVPRTPAAGSAKTKQAMQNSETALRISGRRASTILSRNQSFG